MSNDAGDRWRLSSFVWLIVAALFGGTLVKQVATTSSPSKPQETAGAPRSAANNRQPGTFLAPLSEFLVSPDSRNGIPIPSQLKWLICDEDYWGRNKLRIKSQVDQIEFLIAVVADPLDTQSSYLFDQEVDTLHRVVGREGYVLEGYYFPWKAGEPSDRHRNEPGTLLYRSASRDSVKKTNLLVIFLVGSTPTTGIHKTAFRAAANQIKAAHNCLGMGFCPLPSVDDASRIMIAGPPFSGAADSLARAIRERKDDWKDDCDEASPNFCVITTAALAIDQQRFRQLAGAGVTISSTSCHVDALRQAVINHLADANGGQIRVAILSESATLFGASGSTEIVQVNESNNALNPIMAGKSKGCPPESQDAIQAIEFRFPMNISSTRARVEEIRRATPSASVTAPLRSDLNRLPLPFDNASSVRELPPLQTPTITEPTVELILGQMIATIRNHGVQCVLISATDVRDPIFLAAVIRAQAPSVQIVLIDSDLLHLHSDHRSVLQGTLVASSYPYHPDAQDWCFPFQGLSHKVILANHSCYALYNSVSFLRGIQREQFSLKTQECGNLAIQFTGADTETARPFWPIVYGIPLADVQCGSNSFQPPVWLSMIGSNAIWPVICKDIEEVSTSAQKEILNYTLSFEVNKKNWTTKNGATESSPKFDGRLVASSGWVMWGWAVAGLAMAFAPIAACWGRTTASTNDDWQLVKALRLGEWSAPLGFCTETANTSVTLWSLPHVIGLLRHLFRLAMALCILFAVAVNIWVCKVSLLSDHRVDFRSQMWFRFALCALSCVVAAGLIAVISSDVWSLISTAWSSKPGSQQTIKYARWATSAIAIVLFFWWIFGKAEPAQELLDFKSLSDLWNGISLLMPIHLSLAAVLVLGYCFLWQAEALLSERVATVPKAVRRKQIPKTREDLARRLMFPLVTRIKGGGGLALAIVAFATGVLWFTYIDHELVILAPSTVINNLAFWGLVAAISCWCLRFLKTQQLCRDFQSDLEAFFVHMPKCKLGFEADKWKQVLGEIRPPRTVSMSDLWMARLDHGRSDEVKMLLDVWPKGTPSHERLDEQLYALRTELYVRRYCRHIMRLLWGLSAAGLFILLAAISFPSNVRPFLQLNVTLMMLALGALVIYYYVCFDRNVLISALVGSEPNQVEWNWSMAKAVIPVALLVFLTIVSQAFPEVWGWMRDLINPMIKNAK